MQPTGHGHDVPLYGERLIAQCAARALAGLERDGGRSAGPGWAARGERSEPP